MTAGRRAAALLLASSILVPAVLYQRARGSDHADTPIIAATPGADLTDLHIFPSATNPNNVVLSMCVHPLIPTGQSGSVSFDPTVLYQFKIDTTGDAVEDLVIQMKAVGTGPNQIIYVSGPVKPAQTGTVNTFVNPDPITGRINQIFTASNGMQVFAGAREDPFFIDLNQLFTILPDRATPVNGVPVAPADANTPKATSWRPPGQAQDFLAGLNVLAFVVEVPRSMLGGGPIGVWVTTSK